MSYNTVTVLKDGTETDITPKELQALEKFKEAGMPGLGGLSDITMTKAIDLYLAGRTYFEISRTLGIKKDLILFLAQKFKWYETKMEHLEILDATIKERVIHAKLVNQDFTLQIQQFFLKKIGRKMTRFLATNDEDVANQVDRKDIELYFKSVDILDKITTERVPVNGQRPTVGLNLGEGVTVRKVGENEVQITPRSRTVADMLKELADTKRDQEKDLAKENDKNEGSENKP